MLVVGDAVQSRVLLALSSRADEHDFFIGIAVHLFGLDESRLVALDEPHGLGDLDVGLHGVAVDGNFLSEFLGSFDNLLYAGKE